MPKSTSHDDAEWVECHSRAEWRAWLEAHHAQPAGVWLVYFKKHVAEKHIPYDDMVEEALCFGWVDSRPGKVDDDRTRLYFSPRKPKSAWGMPNKLRVAKLEAAGLMRDAGRQMVELAKQTGTWTTLDAVEANESPPDLIEALKGDPTAETFFAAFPPGVKKNIGHWIVLAKKPETRAKRVAETVRLAAKNIRANQPGAPKSEQ